MLYKNKIDKPIHGMIRFLDKDPLHLEISPFIHFMV